MFQIRLVTEVSNVYQKQNPDVLLNGVYKISRLGIYLNAFKYFGSNII